MPILISILAVFFLLRTAKLVVSAPPWFWVLLLLGLSTGAVIVAMNKGYWYYSFAVAGGVTLAEALDDLITVKRDETLRRLTRGR